MTRRQGNHLARWTRLFALTAFLLIAAAFASFLLLNSATLTTTIAQQQAYTKYKSVSSGAFFSCAIREVKDSQGNATVDDGKIDCWGGVMEHIAGGVPSTGGWSSVSVGGNRACASKSDGTIQCFGSESTEINQSFTSRKYHSVSIGEYHACGVLRDDSVASNDRKMNCVKFSEMPTFFDYKQHVVPTSLQSQKFKSVTVGVYHTCGIRSDDMAACWGSNGLGESTPPSVALSSIDAGSFHTCGIKSDGTATCWGSTAYDALAAPRSSTFTMVSSGGNYACGIDRGGTIECWGSNRHRQSIAPLGTFASLSAGRNFACAIGIDTDPATSGNQGSGSIACWGEQIARRTDPPSGQPTPVVPTSTPQPAADRDTVVDIAMGWYTDCLLTGAGTAKCIGNRHREGAPPVSRYRAVSVGWAHSCGIDHYGSFVRCWGLNRAGEASPPEGTFKKISAGARASCGIKTDGYIACWGVNETSHADDAWLYGQVDDAPVSGTFVDISLSFNPSRFYGSEHACALRDDGVVICWGQDSFGQATPPSNFNFKAVATGPTASCGIVKDSDTTNEIADENENTVKCWGRNRNSDNALKDFNGFAKSTTFKQLDIAEGHICGVVLDNDFNAFGNQGENTIKCSGRDNYYETGGSIFASTYRLVRVGVNDTCALGSDYNVECHGNKDDPGDFPLLSHEEINIAKIPKNPSNIPQKITSGSDEYEVAAPLQGGGAFATDGSYYVSVPPAALPDSRVFGIRMFDAGPVSNVIDDDSLHIFRGSRYTVAIVDGNGVTIPRQTLTRPVDICIPVPQESSGQIYEPITFNIGGAGGGSPISTRQFFDAGGLLCAETYVLPITVAVGLRLLPPSPTPTPTPIFISRITPSPTSVTLVPGDKVRLSVNIYGVQDILDNSLGDRVTFDWSVDPRGGLFEEVIPSTNYGFEAEGREVLFTLPRSPGTYKVKVALDALECDDQDGLDDGCFAEIEVTVRRSAAPPSPEPTPANPAGEIPKIITDSDGNKYEVFTPEEGGNFEDNGVSVVVEPGVVPNGEIIGVRVAEDGEASNVGQTHHRVTLDGSYYGIYAVDASGQGLNGYLLDDPISVCLPVPSRFTSNVSQLTMVSEQSDGTFATLSSSIRLSTSGVLICGGLSEVSARLAVGNLGSPSALPSPTPLPTPIDPDTGGSTMPTSAFLLLLILGTALAAVSLTLLKPRHSSIP